MSDLTASTAPEPAVSANEDNLAGAVKDVCWKATPFGEREDGSIASYIVPSGAMHRLIGAAQSAGVNASFRAALSHSPEALQNETVSPALTPPHQEPSEVKGLEDE